MGGEEGKVKGSEGQVMGSEEGKVIGIRFCWPGKGTNGWGLLMKSVMIFRLS
jgi:hypothetical protein